MTRLLCLVAALLAACSTDARAPFGYTDGDLPGRIPANPCASPQTGCPCDEPEATVQCGEVEREGSTSVTCAYGSRTCKDGKWGACQTTSTRVQSNSAFRTLALGGVTSCASVCDPFCTDITDSHTGLTPDVDAGVIATDAGLSLVRKEVTSTSTRCEALSISASPAALTITALSPLSPNTVQLTPSVSPSNCYPAGTPPVVWAIDRFDIATIGSTGLLTLVSPIAGPIVVTAYAGSLSATATVNVVIDVLDTSTAPASALDKFVTATGSADANTVLYPYANTVFPLGLLAPLVQWRPAQVATAVKVSLRYPATGTPKFQWSKIAPENETMWLDPPANSIPLPSGPRFTIPQSVWSAFEQTAKGDVAAIAIQRWSTALSLRAEVATQIRFATGQLKGTVYYQSYGTNLVKGTTAGAVGNFSSTYSPQTYGGGKRFGAATLAISPGATYPTVAAGYYSSSDGPGCRVCHSGSASGTVLVSQVYGSAADDSRLYRLGVDAADAGLSFAGTDYGKFSWPAIYPDGSFIFSNSGPPPDYGTAPPGGLDQSAWVSGAAPPNALYSLVPGSVGNVISSSGIPSALRATLPVFSPDGKKLAFNHYAGTVSTTSGNKTGDKRSLATMDFDVTTKTFSNLRRLWDESSAACSSFSSDPCTNLWPSFLPDNSGLVYEREVFNNGRVSGSNHSDFGGTRSGCDGTGACGDDGTKADLWWVTLGTPAQRARMNAANGLDASNNLTIPTGAAAAVNGHTAAVEGVLNYEPTLSPQQVGGYFWVAFTSRRLYGNVATMNPWWSDPRFKPIGGGNGPTTKKIWVAAIKPGATAGSDPSYPAFYLPGQELLAGNSKAFWSLDTCKAASSTRSSANACETNLDCCGAPTTAICSLQTPIADPPVRHCIPLNSSMCIPDNSATQCTTHAECCGFSAGSRCANGVCQLPPPLKLFDVGDYTRDFKADCPTEQKPVWKVFEWQATLPPGSSIVFKAATAATAAALATATQVDAGTAEPPTVSGWATNPVQIDTKLSKAGLSSQEYLRIRMTLNPSSDKLQTPLLTDWRIRYDCVDAE